MELAKTKNNCKNCHNALTVPASYCQVCGAKVIKERLSIKGLLRDFFHKVFGWDNTYFRTFKKMLVSPEVVISNYIGGVRKRFMPPITFLVIGLTISSLIFNAFSEKYVEFSTRLYESEDSYKEQFEEFKSKKTSSVIANTQNYEIEFKKYTDDKVEFQRKLNRGMLKYFNILSFISIPLYTLISMLVFGWKKHNYSEHLVINCYVQGLSMIGLLITFILALLIHPNIYPFSVLISIFYYSFAYKKLYALSLGKTVLKLVKFVLVLLLIMTPVIALIAGVVILFKN